MVFSCTHNEIIGLFLLHHEPHRFYIVRGIPPVPFRFKGSQLKLFLLSKMNSCNSIANFPCHKLKSSSWRLMVEKYSRHRKHTVAFSIVNRSIVSVNFRHPIWTSGIKSCSFFLWNLCYFSKHLRRRSLIKFNLFIYLSYRFKHSCYSKRCKLPGEDRLFPRCG